MHSSYSELACDSQQISDTQPKFRQVPGCSDVQQPLANSKKLLPDPPLGTRFRILKKTNGTEENLPKGPPTKQGQGCIYYTREDLILPS